MVRYVCTNGTRERRQACSLVAEGQAFARLVAHNQALLDNQDHCRNVVSGAAYTKAMRSGAGLSDRLGADLSGFSRPILKPPTLPLSSEDLSPKFKRTSIPREEKEPSHPTYLYRHYYKPLQRPPSYERTDPVSV